MTARQIVIAALVAAWVIGVALWSHMRRWQAVQYPEAIPELVRAEKGTRR